MTETRGITVLFTDLVDSTAIASALTPEAADELRRQHFEALRRAIVSSAGTEVKNLGDGLMVVFSAASTAVGCAVAMQQEVHWDNVRTDRPLGLRIGISVGEVTQEADDYFGETVIEAARLCARAEAGQILATNLVRVNAGRRTSHTFVPLGALELKGLPEPVETVEIVWEPLEANAPRGDAAWTFGVLGPLVISRDGEEIQVSGDRRRALLLRLLVSRGRAVPTETLIEDVWEGAPPPGATSTIKSHISHLRKLLVGQIRLTASGYVLDLRDAELDVNAFESDLLQGRRALEDGDPDAAAPFFERALDLWRGEPLIDVGGAAWALPEISRLAESKVSALELLQDARLAAGRHLEVVPSAEAAINKYPLRERLWAQLMVALYRSGRQADALRAFQRLRSILADELGIEPSNELVQLEEEMIRQSPDLARHSSHSGRGQAAHLIESDPKWGLIDDRLMSVHEAFVDREMELAFLESELKASIGDSHPRIAMLSGEPGIGKTSLAAKLSSVAGQAGVPTVYGRCDQDLGIPYQPWREALSYLFNYRPGAFDHLVRERKHVLAIIDPPDPGDPEPRDAVAHDPYVLFQSVLRILAAAAKPDGLVLVLDDLHWADAQTLQLIRMLATGTLAMPLLVLATFRETEVAAGSALASLLADLHRARTVSRVSLTGLGDLDVLSLLEQMAGGSVGEGGIALRDALVAETDGNPFFIRELVRHLVETGVLEEDDAGRWSVDEDIADVGLPASLREVIGERVARLGANTARLLTFASVIGHEFDIGVLATVAQMEPFDVLEGVDSAIEASLVIDRGGERFSFAHALLRRSLYDELSPTRRSYMHSKVASAIEAFASDDPTRAGELAHHWLNATVPRVVDKALEWTKRAGDFALSRLAPNEALRWYEEALTLLERHATNDARTRCEILVGRGDAQRQSGDPDHRQTLLDAARLAIDLDETDLLVRAVLANTRGMFANAGNVDTERVELLEEAARRTEGWSDGRRARVVALLAAELAFDIDHVRRRGLADEALALARSIGDQSTLLTVLNYRFATVQTPDNLAEVLEESAEALRLAEVVQNPVQLALARGTRYFASLQAADFASASQLWLLMEASALELRQPTWRWFERFLAAHRAMTMADLGGAMQIADEALAIGTETGQPDAFSIYGAQVIQIIRERDEPESLIPVVEGAVAANPNDRFAVLELSRLACDVAQLERARECVLQFIDDPRTSMAWDVFWLTTVSKIADTVADLRWQEAGISIYAALQPYSRQCDWISPSAVGPVGRPLGRLAALLGLEDQADNSFAQALALSEALESPLYVAQTYLDWGRVLVERKSRRDRDRATTYLEHAGQLAARHGLLRVARLGRDALESLH